MNGNVTTDFHSLFIRTKNDQTKISRSDQYVTHFLRREKQVIERKW